MLAKPLLVFSSYALLFALLAIRIESESLRVVLVAMAVLGVASLALVFRVDSTSAPVLRTVKSISQPGPEAGGYLVSYLLPFVISSTPSVGDILAYSIFLVVAGVITASTGAVQVNPLLYLIGYRVVRVAVRGGAGFYMVTKTIPLKDDVIEVTLLQPDVVVMKRSSPPIP